MVVIYFYVVPLEENNHVSVIIRLFKFASCNLSGKYLNAYHLWLSLSIEALSVLVSIIGQQHWGSEALAGWGSDIYNHSRNFPNCDWHWPCPMAWMPVCSWTMLDYVGLCWTMCTSRMLLQICVTLKNCRSCILRLFSSTQTHTQEATGRFASKDHSRSESETHPDTLTAFLAVEGHVLC